jgi:hypothetical protein
MILDTWQPLRLEDEGRTAVISNADTHWASCVRRSDFARKS